MKIEDLRFDNPNNICQSLRILAEMARKDEVHVQAVVSGATLKLAAFTPMPVVRKR